MGKPKKASQDQDHDDFENGEMATDDLGENSTDIQTQPSKEKRKKNKKGKQKDEEWDEIESEIQALKLEDNKFVAEDEDDAPVVPKKGKNKKKGMSAFALLAEVGGDDDDEVADLSDKQSDDEDVKKEEEVVTVQKPKKKEKAKKEKAKKPEDEDIDALLADIESAGKGGKGKKKKNKGDVDEGNEEEAEPVPEVEKIESKVVSIDDLEDEFEDEKKKKKKNKKKGKEEEETQEDKKEDGDAEDGEGELTMKSAAQKKKEKKEREKQKKIEEKQKQLKKEQAKKEREEREGVTKVEKGKEEAPSTIKESQAEDVKEAPEPSPSHEATPEADEVEEKDGKKKKKKKGAAAEKEKEEKKEEKKPGNKKLLALKEALRLAKEEEERLKREEEAFKLQEEERIRKYEEELKRKEEAKRLKKQAKKEREAQLKKEGKFLTEKQKNDRRKLEQMLEAMKLAGMEVGPRPDSAPAKGDSAAPAKGAIVYGKKKGPRKMGNKEKSPTTPSEESPKLVPSESQEEAKKEVEVPEVKEKVVKDDVKDEWDAESEEEEEEEKEDASPEKTSTTTPTAVTPEAVEAKEEEKEEVEDEEEEEEESEESEESESETDEEKTPIERGRDKIQKRTEKAEKTRTLDHLRAPVVCVLGHVDTGKTKILDKLRRTNVQDGEAGGITQQIGATNVPKDAVMEKTKMVKEFAKQELKLPGLLIIDTPGHESFSNLRLRGSSLCDIAILVIDIMHGLEPQTIESIKLLKERKTPFLVALNKIDRLYQWKPQPMADVQNTLKKQSPHTKAEFDERAQKVILQLAEEGLNASLFYENKNPREYVSLVPTSAHSGDGMGNLVALVCELCQSLLAKRLMYSPELQATVMEVKAITGMGTTIDVILINGSIKEGDCIVLAGTEGPIITHIRGLLMPQPMKELRVKNQYEHHKEVIAAQGVKINAKEMEKCLAGLPLYVAHDNDEKEFYKNEVAAVLKDTLEAIKVQDRGVFVQASTLGSLEALLEFLRTSKIPYAGINIGPVHKKDIMRASVMLEHDSQYAVILAFDVKVEREAQEMADSLGVRIFTAEIIYHLFDAFTKYREDLKKQKQEEFKHIAVFPCKLRVLPQFVFNSRDPIVMGVSVETGFLKEGTPICVPSKEFVDIGRVASLELNHKQVDIARQGQEVCIKILPNPGEAPKMYGRHFEDSDMLVSKISRQSIDAVKDYFRDEMTKPDWRLMVELKKQFQIL